MMAFYLEIPVSSRSHGAISATLQSLIGPIGSIPGCLDCRLFQELGEHRGLMLHQLWVSQNALEAHLRSDICRKLLEVVEMAGQAPKIEFHDIARSRGIEYIEAVRLSG